MSENAKRLSEIEQRHARIINGTWEWSDCFDPARIDCGMVQVRIPSNRAWDTNGWFYLFIADMEWATAEDLGTAEFIANAPEDVNWLIDRVHELEDQLKRMSTTSGYWLDNVAVTDPPAEPCPICNDTQDGCPACPPADDAVYLADWRAGAFDDELEAAFYVGYEWLLGGAE